MKRILDIKGVKNGLYLKIEPEASLEDILAQLNQQLKNTEFYSKSEFIGIKGRDYTYYEKAQMDNVIFERLGKNALSLEPYTSRRSGNTSDIRDKVYKEYQKLIDNEIEPKMAMMQQELDIEKEEVAKLRNEIKELKEFNDKGMQQKSKSASSEEGFIHTGTIRSGNLIKQKGHVVIIGDINPGAEVVSDGNIICIGKALGVVHAGAAGDYNAFVLASTLAPTQIRIANFVSGPASGKNYKPKDVPEIASLVDKRITIKEV